MIIPLKNKILIKPFESDEFSEGGLFVPENCRTRNNKAIIINVGNGTSNRPMIYKKGMIVYHVKDAGQEIEENKEKMFLIEDIDILALA
jgi:co-chaperonin GroES (HSP10)